MKTLRDFAVLAIFGLAIAYITLNGIVIECYGM